MAYGHPTQNGLAASSLGLGQRGLLPALFDVTAFIIIVAAFVALAHGAREMSERWPGSMFRAVQRYLKYFISLRASIPPRAAAYLSWAIVSD
jgi:type IV secretory pathway TrbD component